MSRFVLLAAAAALLPGCSLLGSGSGSSSTGGGGAGTTAQDPMVYDSTTQNWDIAALKEGEWVETETKGSGYSSKSKMACVGMKDGLVWVEMTGSNQEGWVTLLGVDKGDRKTKKAFWGKSGEEGKEIKVQAMPTAGTAGGVIPKYKGTVKISKDTVTVGGTSVECEKNESNITMTYDGKDTATSSTSWMSDKVPFRSWYDEKATSEWAKNTDIKYEGKSNLKGAALVKMTTEGSSTMIVGMGTDAKMTLKLPAPK